MNEDDLPLIAGSIRGYRSWKLLTTGMLRSVFISEPWESSEHSATCNAPGSLRINPGMGYSVYTHSHPAPRLQCRCGIYAYTNPDPIIQPFVLFKVHGVIEGFGHTIVHERGFRSENARILALNLPYSKSKWFANSQYDEYIAKLQDRYHVPVFRHFDKMVEMFPRQEEG